jgi:hypothetical protein
MTDFINGSIAIADGATTPYGGLLYPWMKVLAGGGVSEFTGIRMRGDILDKYGQPLGGSSGGAVNYVYYGNGTFEIALTDVTPLSELIIGGGTGSVVNYGASANQNARWISPVVDRLNCQINVDADVLIRVDMDLIITDNTGAGTSRMEFSFNSDFAPAPALGTCQFLAPPSGQSVQISANFLRQNWVAGGMLGQKKLWIIQSRLFDVLLFRVWMEIFIVLRQKSLRDRLMSFFLL